MPITIDEVPWDHPVGERLRREQVRETKQIYDGEDHEEGPKPSAADIDVFLLATDTDTGETVGCGGLRRLDPTTFEIKRMYVVPEWRGRRIGKVLVGALEDTAEERGAARIRLETGDRMPDAMRLYERCGYYRIDRYGYYADSDISVCYERVLVEDTLSSTPR
ncbi:GNAT family N-acetyltransferase [Nocardiopsis gilva YIM 90087]|uniref:GNAT family N-acetyltransferase n=1 Tax=Nocardiopsis gilva YIM 90087 TaxID=1235441 RepID=A0A223S4A5_9ACTN|nr:GNAT family N-acetyltransferase [Nocardiopsis gilva]ASU82948.1 GNAT family N-acetyltransferase [Nocardiopsis gilva YIM 90087]